MSYSLVESTTYKINELLDINFETENNIIPQADDINKVLELLSLVNVGQNSTQDIADYFLFTTRQSLYYGEATASLGLLTRYRGFVELTTFGTQFITTPPARQQLFIAKTIVNSWYFRELIHIAKNRGYFTKTDIQRIIVSVKKADGSQRYTTTTVPRRHRTIVSWTKWLADEFSCFKIADNEYRLV